MSRFKDSLGRRWTLTFTDDNLAEINRDCSIYFDPLDLNLIRVISHDEELFLGILYAMCREQAEARSVSKAAFCNAIVGKPIEDAGYALIEAMIAAFPEDQQPAIKAEFNRFSKERGYSHAIK